MMRTDNEEELLRSVALQTASSVLVARQHAERRNEAYLRRLKGSAIREASDGGFPAASFFGQRKPFESSNMREPRRQPRNMFSNGFIQTIWTS
jgi:hypothetical protein